MFDFKEELHKISEQRLGSEFIEIEKDITTAIDVFNDITTKILKKQGAMSMQVEEMYSMIEGVENENIIEELKKRNEKMVNALITAADLVEDFYMYYQEHYDQQLTAQSEIMWNAQCKAMAVSGLIRISDENTPFNMHLNTVEGVTRDISLPNGSIIKVLKSGYLYQDKVCRKSTVIVNKLEDKSNE